MVDVIVNIDVPDLAAARQFYESGLGFRFERSLFQGSVLELRAGVTAVYLIQRDAGSPAVIDRGIERDYADHWTPVHLDVIVDDIDAALERALEAGAILPGTVSRFDWGRLAALRDPFGHGICLLQFLGGGYDRVED